LLPGRHGRLPRRLQRRLRPRVRSGQDPFPVRNHRPPARRSRVGRRQPVLRPVGLRLRMGAAAAPARPAQLTDASLPSHRGETAMPRQTKFRRAALWVALGACIAATSPAVFAQSATGAVAGRATAGDQITVTSADTGLTRTINAGSEGAYRLAQLPVGDYTLMVSRNGQTVGDPIRVNVGLGGTTTVNVGGDGALVNLEAVQVVGSRVVNRVDVRSTESATNIRREELARLPVDQSLAAVALLAPGVVASGATFGGLTFGGSSVAENAAYINGLNVTDPYRRQGFSSVPFGFYEEFQVKTGGYSAEFGRTTGGVINAVTRSGTNEFKSGAQVTMEPRAWTWDRKDQFHSDGTIDERDRRSRDGASLYKANVWASGPIIRDRL